MSLIVFACVLAAAAASIAPVTYTIPFAVSSQFHSQDTLGQYTYGYSNPLSSKTEARSIDGITRGGYSYVDADGNLQSVQYISDAVNGFRVAATNLPQAPAVPEFAPLPQPTPVEETPEVSAARATHLAALEEARVRSAPVVQTYAFGSPAPIFGYTYPAITTYGAFIATPQPAPPQPAPNANVVTNTTESAEPANAQRD